MDSILESFNQAIGASPLLAIALVFLGGVLTSANPCVLAMIPLMMSFVLSRREDKPGAGTSFLYSFAFVVGLSITFTALGVLAVLLGRMFGDVSTVWNYIIFGVCLIMGLHLLGVFTVPVPSLNIKPRTGGVLGMLVMGVLFGFVSTPCVVPILLVILTYLAGADTSIAYGALLLFLFSIGHAILILVAGTSMGLARRLLESKRFARINTYIQRGAGAVIIAVGVYFLLRAFL